MENPAYIDNFIREGQSATLSLKNFYDTMLVSDIDNKDHIIRIPIGDFFLKYKDQLEGIEQYYHLPDKYFYKPKTLSLELYDTTEMWLSLLRVNGMRNITEFSQSIIKVYNPAEIKEFINIFFKREGKIT